MITLKTSYKKIQKNLNKSKVLLLCDGEKRTKFIKDVYVFYTDSGFSSAWMFDRALTLKASQITVSTDSFSSVGSV